MAPEQYKNEKKRDPLCSKKSKNLTNLLEGKKARKKQTQSTRVITQTLSTKIKPPAKKIKGHKSKKIRALAFFQNVSFPSFEGNDTSHYYLVLLFHDK